MAHHSHDPGMKNKLNQKEQFFDIAVKKAVILGLKNDAGEDARNFRL